MCTHGSDLADEGEGEAEAEAEAGSAKGRLRHVPRDLVQVRFARSGGPGGQNVNKLNTKADVRVQVLGAEADAWLGEGPRERLLTRQGNRINKEGELVVQSTRYRTQRQNLADALSRLDDLVGTALAPPKERKLKTGISKATKAARMENKRRRSAVKQGRKGWRGLDD